MAWNTDHCRVLGDIPQHDRTGANSTVLSHGDIAEDLSSAADNNIVLEGRMALSPLFAGAAERDSLIKSNVVTDDRRFTNDNSHPVVDKKTPADLGAGV